jgi:hypothetical protein
MLLESVAARGQAGVGLNGFLAQADKRGPASVIVFAPPEPSAWLTSVTRLAGRRQLRVVIAVDGVQDNPREPGWLRLFRSERAEAGARAAGLEEVMQILGRARVPVTLLDRSSGVLLGDIRRRALGGKGKSPRFGSREARDVHAAGKRRDDRGEQGSAA